jgi:uncharacterized protein (DUF427 family)
MAIEREAEAPMVKASWNGATIAESDDTVVVEGNHYFPRASVDAAMLRDSATTTICPWKGTAHYHNLVVDGVENGNAAWYYPDPEPAAAEIRDRIAFWKGVEVG